MTHRHPTTLLVLLAALLSAACAATSPAALPTPAATAAPPTTFGHTESIAGSRSLAYDLGAITITQSLAPVEFRELPIPLIGAIAVPEGDGPFPVAVVLHGRHTRCYADPAQLEEVWPCPPGEEPRYDVGFAYLLDALSARGYLAVAPSINGAYTTAWGMGTPSLDETQVWVDERLTQIVAAHLDRLVAAGAGQPIFGPSLDLMGKVDSSAVALVAHSTAGHTANTLARDGVLPVRALLLVAPMRFAGAGTPAGVATTLLLSACDGDRPDLPGQEYFEAARLQPDRATPFAAVLLAGANHNFYNTELAQQGIDDAQFGRNPDCAAGRLPAEAQQAFLAALAADHVDAAFGRLAAPPLFLDASAPAATELYGQAAQVSLVVPAASRLTLFTPPAAADAPPGETTGPLAIAVCPPDEPCSQGLLQPGQPGQLRLTWDAPGGVLRLPLPAGAAGYTTLRLRLAVDPLHPANAAAAPITLSVALSDSAGNRAVAPLPAPLPFPAISAYESDGFRHTPILPHDVRLPLSSFAGVDTATLTAVELVFDATPAGSVLVADMELWK